MSPPSHSIVIVGGGFSGAALATSLLEAGGPGLAIHVVESRPRLGWGTAYGDADPVHILNVPADRMSPWSERPDDFLTWARHHGPRLGWPEAAAADVATYLPRRLFGHYVQTRLDEAVLRAHNSGGPVLFRHDGRVTRVAPEGSGFRVALASGRTIGARQVVVATGFAAPATPFPVAGQGHRFIADPWTPGALDLLGRDDSVLVIGTGLSMVDMVYSLTHAGHRGPIRAVSRHGLLPRSHGHAEDIPPLLDEDDARRGAVHSLRKLRHAISAGQADWRSAMDGLRPVIDRLWRTLPPVEQDRFLRHLKPFWEVHRHRMPAQSSDLLLERGARGGFAAQAARVERLRVDRDGIEATLRPRGKDAVTHRFDWVVNCTPPAAPLADPTSLPSRLSAAGLARPDRTGMGLDVAPDGTIIAADGTPVPGLYALGPLRRGHAIETTAVPHIRPQLEALTALLLGAAERAREAARA